MSSTPLRSHRSVMELEPVSQVTGLWHHGGARYGGLGAFGKPKSEAMKLPERKNGAKGSDCVYD